MHNIKSAILADDIRDCPYCGHKYSVQADSCLASALEELKTTSEIISNLRVDGEDILIDYAGKSWRWKKGGNTWKQIGE